MSLHRLEVFVCIAKHLHMTRAARELHISQPSVSRHMRLLENEFGVALHRKTNQGIELTAEGVEFLKSAQSVLLEYNRLTQRFKKSLARKEIPTLKIGASFGPAVSLLPSLISAFKRSHPKVKVETNYGISEELEQQVLKAEIELALISRSSSSDSVEYYKCGTGERVPFVSSAHSLAKKSKLTVYDLEKYPLILRTSAGKRSTRTWEQVKSLEREGIELKVSMDIVSPRTLVLAVIDGLGIGFTELSYLRDDLKRGLIKVMALQGFKNIYEVHLIYVKERSRTFAAECLLALARQRKGKSLMEI